MNRKTILISFATFAIIGCGNHKNDSAIVTAPVRATNGQASYAWIRANIIDPKCMDCHSANQGDGDGLDKANFDTFEGVLKVITPGQPETSLLYKMVLSKKMPKGMDAMPGMPAKPGVPLTDSELQAISDWISLGAQNN
ncbi:MAG: c-type cytochrome domain-containing protein [Bdellovibrionota bacterium]